jgi:hypothetical protein
MKKIAIVAVLVLAGAMLSGSAFAANSIQQGTFGISVGFANLSQYPDGIENTLIGRMFLAPGLAVNLGVGFTNTSADACVPGYADGTDMALVLGVRKYLKTDDFAPFAEGDLVYMTQDSTGLDTIGVMVNFGAEYFLHRQFSLEGSIGAALLKASTNTGPNADATQIGTSSLGVRANFYF